MRMRAESLFTKVLFTAFSLTPISVGRLEVRYPADRPDGRVGIAGHRILKSMKPDPTDPYPLASSRVCNISTVIQDAMGRYLLNGRSLFMFDENKDRWTWLEANAFTQGTVLDTSEGILEDRSGKVWALCWLRPSCFDGLRWRVPDVPGINEDFARNFPESARETVALEETVPFRTMLRTRDGNIWFVRGDQMLENAGERWVAAIRPPNQIENDYRNLGVRSVNGQPAPTIREVADKKLLFGRSSSDKATYLDLIRRRPLTVFCETYSALEDREGYIWLGADRGILRFSTTEREWKLYQLPKNLVQAALIYEGRDRRLWFADLYGNVAVYNKLNDAWTGYRVCETNPRIKRDFPGSSDYPINAIYEDRAAHVMFGTFDGLVVFTERDNKWERFTSQNSALPGVTLIGSETPTSKVTAIMQDRSERIWLATNGGILILDP